MTNSICLNWADCSLQLNRRELEEYLNKLNAGYTKVDETRIRVDGPQAVLDSLHEANACLAFPFFDPSH